MRRARFNFIHPVKFPFVVETSFAVMARLVFFEDIFKFENIVRRIKNIP